MGAQRVEEVAKTRVAHETNEGIKADEGAAHRQGDHNKKLKTMLKKNAIRPRRLRSGGSSRSLGRTRCRRRLGLRGTSPKPHLQGKTHPSLGCGKTKSKFDLGMR